MALQVCNDLIAVIVIVCSPAYDAETVITMFPGTMPTPQEFSLQRALDAIGVFCSGPFFPFEVGLARFHLSKESGSIRPLRS